MSHLLHCDEDGSIGGVICDYKPAATFSHTIYRRVFRKEFDKLAAFGGNLKKFNDAASDADALWETTLNSVLKPTMANAKARLEDALAMICLNAKTYC
jgi:hypothetical protein